MPGGLLSSNNSPGSGAGQAQRGWREEPCSNLGPSPLPSSFFPLQFPLHTTADTDHQLGHAWRICLTTMACHPLRPRARQCEVGDRDKGQGIGERRARRGRERDWTNTGWKWGSVDPDMKLPSSHGAVPRKIPPIPLFLPSAWLRLGEDAVPCLCGTRSRKAGNTPSGVA